MMTTTRRKAVIANIMGLRTDMILTSRDEDETSRQVDLWATTRSGKRIRLGYFDHNTFWRANPVDRALLERGLRISEGAVGPDSEPQYDMVFTFAEDGALLDVTDNRTSMEVWDE